MPVYVYRCATDGPVDVRRPLGPAPVPAAIACPACGEHAPRLFTAPMLGLADRARTSVIDRAEASRTEPDVVTSLPARPVTPGRATPRLDPRTAALPRP